MGKRLFADGYTDGRMYGCPLTTVRTRVQGWPLSPRDLSRFNTAEATTMNEAKDADA